MKRPRNTATKKRIKLILDESPFGLSHSAIRKRLADICNRVTVYRVLDRMVDEGLVYKITNLNQGITYVSTNPIEKTEATRKIDFICQKCNRITRLKDINLSLDSPTEFIILEINCTIACICPACADSKPSIKEKPYQT